jgi:protein-S-isoprenylcysteine O-methyltransferase Ste14
MVKMRPEQEAAYALDFGVARSDLPEDARLAYDRLVEQRARARAAAPVSRADAGGRGRVTLPERVAAAVGTALFMPVAAGFGIVLVPYLITHWQSGGPYPLGVRVLGVALIAAGGILFVWGCVRFAAEGVGMPIPTEPTSRLLTVGGPYRYVRNPLYLAWVMAITGQALLLSRPVLLSYAGAVLIIAASFVHWYEEPTLARRFGAQYEAYRKQVPGWWPRLPRRTLSSNVGTPSDPAQSPGPPGPYESG